MMESLLPHSRRLNVVVNECLDATDYFSRFNNGENRLKLHYECTCSGDLGFKFTLQCELNDYCFLGGGDGTKEQCISRKNTFDFVVNSDTRVIADLTRNTQLTTYHSGFSFDGSFLTVGNNACVVELNFTYNVPTEEAIDTCDNRCHEFFIQNSNRTQDEIEYICPTVTYDNVACKSFRMVSCLSVNDTDEIRYFTMPDCSNVDPCLGTSCQPYPRIDTSPEAFLFRYPECKTSRINNPTASPTMTSLSPVGDNSNVTSSLSPTVSPPKSTSIIPMDSAGFSFGSQNRGIIASCFLSIIVAGTSIY
ncbi:unnamed protein product [Cylindrotheca closterium]|uniref:Uncharacterized protein n=1 Tax=Cylindrotheca closterium TaxID=2856 RepID=A0AAD2CMJ5_9STRA|nr:unnamed protein product [Cylindrotheca closterium]